MSATTNTARAVPSQPATTAVRPAAPALLDRGRQLGRERRRTAPAGRRRRRDRRPTRARRARHRSRTRPASRSVGAARARAARDRLRDRVLRRVFGRPASCSASSTSTPGATTTSTSSMRPSVIVPVLSTTMLSMRCVASSTSPPLITMPSCAPRPVPTMIAVGVARPERARARDDQHRDRGRERVGCRCDRSPATPPAVSAASASTIGTNTLEMRSARCCTGAFADCAASTRRATWASAVSAPDPRRRHDQAARGVDGRAEHLGARRDLDRHGLAGEHRDVDRARAVDDASVGRDLLARPHDEPVADLEARDRDLVTVLEARASSRRARAARASRATLRPRARASK